MVLRPCEQGTHGCSTLPNATQRHPTPALPNATTRSSLPHLLPILPILSILPVLPVLRNQVHEGMQVYDVAYDVGGEAEEVTN